MKTQTWLVHFECGHDAHIFEDEHGDGSAWCQACGKVQPYDVERSIKDRKARSTPARMLTFTEGPLTGRRIDVTEELVVGRYDAGLTIDDAQISRRHAVFRVVEEGLEIEDLGSLNGTRVNDLFIDSPTRLVLGDVVQLGESSLKISSADTVLAPSPAGALAPAAPSPPARMWWTLGITSMALFMVTLDNLVVTNALPTIQRDFNATIQSLEWSVNAYTLTFAVLLLPGAALGDRFGRRRIFVIGLAIFTAASVAAALSTTIEGLDAARAVQGVGGALVSPLTLTLLSDAFPSERRGLALGLWSGISGIAIALGPVVGGAIVTGIAWQWIFWLNVPIGIVVIPLALKLLRESRGPNGQLDIPGVVLASAGLFGIVWGLIRGSEVGWTSGEVMFSLVAGGVVTVGYVLWELRTPAPMLPMRFFRSRQFACTNLACVLMYFGLFGSLFLIIQFLQVVQGYSALKAGIATLPSTAMPLFVAPVAGILSDKIGGRPLLVTGLFLQTVALGWLAAVTTPDVPYLTLLGPLIMFGIGMGLFFPPTAWLVLASVKPEEEGQASGANNALRELGGVFGVAVLTTIFATYGSYRSGQAFTDGLIPAVWVGTAVVGAGAIVSLFIPRKAPARGQSAKALG